MQGKIVYSEKSKCPYYIIMLIQLSDLIKSHSPYTESFVIFCYAVVNGKLYERAENVCIPTFTYNPTFLY